MNTTALFLVLGAAIAHASWNLCAKRASTQGLPFVWLTSVFAALLLSPSVVIMIATDGAETILTLMVAGLASGIVHGLYYLVLQRGYAVGDISVVYPLARGTGPALSVLIAIVFFGETPGFVSLISVVIIVVGVVSIGLSTGREKTLGRKLGVVFGLATGAIIATYTVLDAYAVTTLLIPPIAFMGATSLWESIILAPSAIRRRSDVARVLRDFRWEIAAVSVLSPLSYVLVLFAFQLAPVSTIAPLRELSVVLVTLAGTILFKEPAGRQRLAGSAIVVAGISLLAVQ